MSTTRTRAVAALAASGAAALLLSACGSGSGAYGGSGGSSPSGSRKAAGGTVRLGSPSAGNVLVDGKGMTLYAFAPGPRGRSTCSGSCAAYWPPVSGKDAKAGASGKVTAHLGTIKRSDGSTQLTVNGFPVYTYVGDRAAGQDKGQGLNLSGGLWWVVSPTGSWIKSNTSSAQGGY